MNTRRVRKKLALVLILGIILGFILGRAVYYRPVQTYSLAPDHTNCIPSVDLSEQELWNTLKELEYHIDYATKLYQRLTAIESRVSKERLRE